MVTLFTISGFAIRIHASWLPLAALIIWSLGAGYFPAASPGLAAGAYWLMAVAGLAGLVACLVAHEMAHAVVARTHGLRVGGITLFLFGGVAELQAEPQSPSVELRMAAAGPAMSLALAALSHGASLAADGGGAALLGYLAAVNLMLGVFNLIPAFPMDGGRMLRALLWAWKADQAWATRMACLSGLAFGLVVMAAGVWQLALGNLAAGMWWMLVGFFVRMAAARAMVADANIIRNS